MKNTIITFICAATLISATACHTRTNVTRTVQHTDGTLETYTNQSDGYNYNPNWTGHSDQNYSTRVNSHNTQNTTTQFSDVAVPVFGFGQFTIR